MPPSEQTLTLRVVTPLGTVVEEPAYSVVLWTKLGEIQVLHGHTPLVALLEPGEMRVQNARGSWRSFAAGEGFAEIDKDTVTVFSDMAEDAEEIALEQAQEAQRRAESALAEAASMTEDERYAADLALRESLVKIQVTLRRRDGTRHRGPSPRQ